MRRSGSPPPARAGGPSVAAPERAGTLPGVSTDFEAEGLLAGIADPAARAARIELLARLEADGVAPGELRRAVAEGRLALLPVERILAGEPCFTRAELAAEAGLDPGMIEALQRSLGLASAGADEPAYDERALEVIRGIRAFMDAGIPPEAILAVTRVLGRSTAAIAEAETDALAAAFAEREATELDVAIGWAEATRELRPLVDPLIGYVLDQQRLQLARNAVVGIGEAAGATRWTAVCFADLVGFTRLGEQVRPDELGDIATRLEALAAEVASGSIRLVKLIGDAAMLVSPDADALVGTALTLIEAADAEGDDFPQLRCGLAAGEALRRSADWYGRPVNLASRLTGIARPGSAVGTQELRDACGGDWAWSFAGKREVRGVRYEVPLFRVRRPAA